MRSSLRLLETPLGWVAAVARSGHLIATSLPQPTSEEAVAACRVEAAPARPDDLLAALSRDLRRYFDGQPVDFTRYPVDLTGRPPFHRSALLTARRIPYGEARTYGWLAKQSGRPRAARAAGQAMRANPLPLVIPCHRVVGAGGALTGFGGGLALKQALLELEGVRCRGGRVLGA
ncbi:MAG TPA: methylated-DNA--[protein]-cysteine S-methyltransferase [Armatimonadota bacterium]|nr:methylated-DNA--[protein]-cysteine S-methyltransferase [Armatimonadota bacterium]